MVDPAAALRALADACLKCDQIAESGALGWSMQQRNALLHALPGAEGWPATADALRAMADEVERLRAATEPDPLRLLLERVIALEHPAALYLWPTLELRINAGGLVVSPDRLWIDDGPDLDAVVAAACARLGVSDVG
jgi:hypothetical protein